VSSAPSTPQYVIFDQSALVAAGRSNIMASRLIHRAHNPRPDSPAVQLYTTACALVSADRERPGTGTHFAALPNVTIMPLDLEAALRIMPEDGWAFPQTRHAAQPSLDLPLGAVVATIQSGAWAGQPVRVLDLTPAH
jgi:hypothetical protein